MARRKKPVRKKAARKKAVRKAAPARRPPRPAKARTKRPAAVLVPETLLRRIALAAAATGKPHSEIAKPAIAAWLEAARVDPERGVAAFLRGFALMYGDALGGDSGVLDPSRLSAALESPREPPAPGGPPPALADRAASLLFFALCRERGSDERDRRLAAAAAAYFLLRNGAFLLAPQEDFERVVRRAAAGEATEDEVAEWLEAHAFWPAPPRPEATRFRLPVAAPAPP